MVVLFVVLQLLPSPPLTVHESAIRLNSHVGTNALLVHALWRGGIWGIRVGVSTMLLEEFLLRCLENTISTILGSVLLCVGKVAFG